MANIDKIGAKSAHKAQVNETAARLQNTKKRIKGASIEAEKKALKEARRAEAKKAREERKSAVSLWTRSHNSLNSCFNSLNSLCTMTKKDEETLSAADREALKTLRSFWALTCKRSASRSENFKAFRAYLLDRHSEDGQTIVVPVRLKRTDKTAEDFSEYVASIRQEKADKANAAAKAFNACVMATYQFTADGTYYVPAVSFTPKTVARMIQAKGKKWAGKKVEHRVTFKVAK